MICIIVLRVCPQLGDAYHNSFPPRRHHRPAGLNSTEQLNSGNQPDAARASLMKECKAHNHTTFIDMCIVTIAHPSTYRTIK